MKASSPRAAIRFFPKAIERTRASRTRSAPSALTGRGGSPREAGDVDEGAGAGGEAPLARGGGTARVGRVGGAVSAQATTETASNANSEAFIGGT